MSLGFEHSLDILCSKCGATYATEFDWQWDEIYRMNGYKNITPEDVDNPDDNYYYRVAMCERCFSKIEKGILIDENHILKRYVYVLHEISSFCYEFSADFFEKMKIDTKKKNSYKKFYIVHTQDLEKLKVAKHFGIKKEKIRIGQQYAIELRKDLHTYIEKAIEKDERYELLKNKILTIEKELEPFLNESKEDIKGYLEINTEDARNLNPYICYDSTVRIPETVETERKFYIGPVEYSKDAIRKQLNKKKFKNRADKYSMDDFFNRLPVKLVKSGFFDTCND